MYLTDPTDYMAIDKELLKYRLKNDKLKTSKLKNYKSYMKVICRKNIRNTESCCLIPEIKLVSSLFN